MVRRPCATMFGLLLLVRSGVFSFLLVSGGRFLACFSLFFLEEEISDCISHGPFICDFTVNHCCKNANTYRREIY